MSANPPFPNDTPAAPGSIPNYMVWSIIITVLATCLCCPLGLVGIVAIVFSSKVNGYLAVGDLEAARRASGTAKTWCWVTTALAIIGLLLNIVMFVTGGAQQYLEQAQHLQ